MDSRDQDASGEAIPRPVTLVDRQGARREYLLLRGDPARRGELRTVRRSQDGVVLDLWWWSPLHQAYVSKPERSLVLDEQTAPALMRALKQLGIRAEDVDDRPRETSYASEPSDDRAREVQAVLRITLRVDEYATSQYLDGLTRGLASGARSALVWFSQVRDVVRVETRIVRRAEPTRPPGETAPTSEPDATQILREALTSLLEALPLALRDAEAFLQVTRADLTSALDRAARAERDASADAG